jgi:hypothetical protein
MQISVKNCVEKIFKLPDTSGLKNAPFIFMQNY